MSAEELASKLKALGEEERAVILKLKEKECKKRELPFNGELHAWDTRYYMNQVRTGSEQEHLGRIFIFFILSSLTSVPSPRPSLMLPLNFPFFTV